MLLPRTSGRIGGRRLLYRKFDFVMRSAAPARIPRRSRCVRAWSIRSPQPKTKDLPRAMLISSATIECLRSFLFREALLAAPNQRARRSVLLTPRLEWQAERRSFVFFPPPVGAGIQSPGVKGARSWNFQCTIQYEVSSRRNDQEASFGPGKPSLRCYK